VNDERTRLVADGYDAMIDTWESWSGQITDETRHAWADDLVARLDSEARVLELGCGGGTRETSELAERFALTGVDLSRRQLERARERVPKATLVEADITTVEFDPASFEAIVSFYAFNHIPRELLRPLLGRIHRWLVPGGWLMTTFATIDEEGWTGEFLGAPTFFSGFAPETNSQLVRRAGFTVERDEVVMIAEPEQPASFQWVLAHR
jgi:cyclopropane fatty-acyl-phospholipid synthase-like methyltransferase